MNIVFQCVVTGTGIAMFAYLCLVVFWLLRDLWRHGL